MLQSLRIRNLVIIEDVDLDFAPGLNLLTGETGAGKSILVDAVGLVVGRRADRSRIRAGAERAVVEALFRVEADSAAAAWMAEQGIDDGGQEGEIVVRRELTASGGSIRINGSPSTLSMLAQLGSSLLELHGQHEFRSLLLPEQHLSLLDRYGGLDDERALVERAFRDLDAARQRLLARREAAAERHARIEQLQKVVREIEAVSPRPGERDDLDRERRLLRHASEVSELLEEIVDLTYEGEVNAGALAARASRAAARLTELDPTMAEIAERLRSAAVEVQEAGAGVRDYRDGRDFDPGRLEQVESRRAAIERLILRYGADEREVLARRERAVEELAQLRGIDRQLAEGEREVAGRTAAYAEAAAVLGRSRRRVATELAPAVERQLAQLALGKAGFEARLSAAQGETIDAGGGIAIPLHPRGAERAEFFLAANPGEPARPLQKVASGGELSRVMLALHAVIDGAGDDRVVVFDEVDAGVGGRVADAVGARLARLAGRNQVLCVTHLPQVAVYADRHFAVRKASRDGRTCTLVETLDDEGRVEELARMLGGKRATPTSRSHAAELLAATGRAAGRAVSRRRG